MVRLIAARPPAAADAGQHKVKTGGGKGKVKTGLPGRWGSECSRGVPASLIGAAERAVKGLQHPSLASVCVPGNPLHPWRCPAWRESGAHYLASGGLLLTTNAQRRSRDAGATGEQGAGEPAVNQYPQGGTPHIGAIPARTATCSPNYPRLNLSPDPIPEDRLIPGLESRFDQRIARAGERGWEAGAEGLVPAPSKGEFGKAFVQGV